MKQKLKELDALMREGGMVESSSRIKKVLDGTEGMNLNDNATDRSKFKHSKNKQKLKSINSTSEDTVYTNAVPKRISSSSEEATPIDTSDETIEPEFDVSDKIDVLLAGEREQLGERDRSRSRSRSRADEERGHTKERLPPTPEDRADKLICDAERAKAKILSVPGKEPLNCTYLHSMLMDESYMLVGAHVDEVTYNKIEMGKYVDFSKLIPKDKIAIEEDKAYQLVMRNGKPAWVPPSEGTAIASFGHWEQAFRVFSNIYTRKFPDRAPELIEYNHVIHTISSTYIWENVYLYDKDFRIHMGNYPSRGWNVVLQHAWNLRLKTHRSADNGNPTTSGYHSGSTNNYNNHNHNHNKNNTSNGGECRRYNRGRCSFGNTCRYEHKCLYCHKFGHAILTCRKLIADREKGVVVKQEKGEKRDNIVKIDTPKL